MKTKARAARKPSPARFKKQVGASLTQLEGAELVRRTLDDELAYLFKHALVQDTAYSSLLLSQRREVHQRVAQAIEQLYAGRLDEFAALLAQHYAETHEDSKTAEYAARAGDLAAKLYAYPEARGHYALALEAIARLPDDDANRRRQLDVLIKQVSVSLRSAGPAETLKRLAEAEILAQEFAARPAATREDRVRLVRVHFWQGHALLHHGEVGASLEKMQAVMAAAQAENEPPLLAVSASVIGRSLVVRGQFPQAIPILTDAIAALEQTYDDLEWIFSVGMRGFAIAMRGDVAQGIAEAERTLVRAEEVGTLTGISVAHFCIAMTHLFCDSIPAAQEHARRVVETAARSGDRLHAYVGNGFLAWAQIRANQFEEADASFARADAIAQAIGARLTFSDGFNAARTEYHLRRGEYPQAISLAQEEIAFAQKTTTSVYTGLIHRVCAQAMTKSAQDWNEIENHLAASLRLFEEDDARLEAARTRMAWGKILQERGETDLARKYLEQAAAQFNASGLKRELEETRILLAAAQ